jgi:dolichol-phosphate mannosyltransferase
MTVAEPSDDTMVLVPTYMEAGTICRLIDALRGCLPDATILVVDDDSPDGTGDLVRERFRDARVEVMTRRGARGFAAAMCAGVRRFLETGAQRLITIDADLSHDPALIERMLAALPDGGLVIGSRYLHGFPRVEWALGRMMTSRLGNLYVRALTGLPIKDCTSGFRCYTRTALEHIDVDRLHSSGYGFQVEVLYWIWRTGCPVSEVEIVYRDRLYGESKLGLSIVLESLALPWRLLLSARGRRGRWTVSSKGPHRERPAA